MLLRVRSLVFEPLERRSMLAADTESLEGVDPTAAIEPAGGELAESVVGCSADDLQEQSWPPIAVCWFRPPEILPGLELPVLLEQQTVDPEIAVSEAQEPFGDDAAGDEEAEPAVDPAEADGESTGSEFGSEFGSDFGSEVGSEVGSDDGTNAVAGGDPDTGVPPWEGLSLEVIRDGSDDGFPTAIHESDPESGDPGIVTCTGVIDWVSPFPWFSTDDGSELTFVLSGPPETGDEWCLVGEPGTGEDPVEKAFDGDAEPPTSDDFGFEPVAYATMVRPVLSFARSATAAGASQVVPTALAGSADDGVASAADVTVADAAVNATPDVTASRATAAAGQADMSRLFAAFAQGLGQGAVDHPAASTVGGRRGARR